VSPSSLRSRERWKTRVECPTRGIDHMRRYLMPSRGDLAFRTDEPQLVKQV